MAVLAMRYCGLISYLAEIDGTMAWLIFSFFFSFCRNNFSLLEFLLQKCVRSSSKKWGEKKLRI